MDDEPIPTRLERFLARVDPALGATVTSYEPISGGYSRVTAVAGIRTADGAEHKLVLRSDPRRRQGRVHQ